MIYCIIKILEENSCMLFTGDIIDWRYYLLTILLTGDIFLGDILLAILFTDDIIDWRYFSWRYIAGDIIYWRYY